MVRPAAAFALFRVFALAIVSVIAAGYALTRYYTHPHQPMLVPVPSASQPEETWILPDGGEIPAPELLPDPQSK